MDLPNARRPLPAPPQLLRRAAALALFALLSLSAPPALALRDSPDPTWTVNGTVNAVARSGDTVYVGGSFTQVGPPGGPFVARQNLAAFNALTGEATSFNPGVDGEVLAMAASDTVVYVGGDFMNIGGAARQRIAAFTGSTGALTGWNPQSDNTVRALAFHPPQPWAPQGVVYVGGDFGVIGGQNRPFLASLEPSNGGGTGFNPQPLGGAVLGLGLDDESVFVGGAFTSVGSLGGPRLVALDHEDEGDPWSNWRPEPNGPVYAIATTSTAVYVGGSFSSIGDTPQPRSNVAALQTGLPPNVGDPLPWNPGADAPVRALATNRGTIYLGGDFSTIAGVARRGLAALDGAGNLSAWDPSITGASSSVLALSSKADTLYVGGSFTGFRSGSHAGFASFSEAPINENPPSVSGDAAVGGTLVCDDGAWSGSKPQSYVISWLRDGAPNGSTGASYVVPAGDGGHSVACKVAATNLGGTTEVASTGVDIPVPPAPPAPPDTTPPSASLTVLGVRLRAALRRGIKVRVRCGEPCRATITLRVDARTAKRFKLGKRTTTIGRKVVRLRARRTRTITVFFNKKARRALARARRIRVIVGVVAQDRNGNRTRRTKRVLLK
jgi:hypothetical protein